MVAMVCRVPRTFLLILRSDQAEHGDVDVRRAVWVAALACAFAGLAGAFAVWAFAGSAAPWAASGPVEEWGGLEVDGTVA